MESNQAAPVPGAGPQTATDNFRRYWLVLLASRWIVINTAAIALTAGILYAFRATPIYEAVGQLMINPEGGGILNGQAIIGLGRDTEYLQSQYRVLQSRTLVEKIVSKLRLDEDPEYRDKVDRVEAVAKDIKVTPIRLTRLVLISSQHPDPTRAKEMVNSLMDAFMADNQQQKTLLANESLRLLTTEVGSTETALFRLSTEIQEYRRKNDAMSLDDRVNIVANGLLRTKELVEARAVSAKEAQQVATDAERWRDSGRPLANYPMIAQDMEVARTRVNLAERESRMSGVTNLYGPRHPTYIRLSAEIASDQNRLLAETQRALASLKARAELEASNLQSARTKLKESEDEVARLNELRAAYEVLIRKRERMEAMFQLLLGKQKELNLSANEIAQNVRVVDYAQVPVIPVKPKKPLVLVASMVLGILVGAGLAFFLAYLNDSVKTVDDVESVIGVRFLGYVSHIDSNSPEDRDLLAFVDPTSAAAEMFRSLRATLQLGASPESQKIMAVTSTVAGEGKSLVTSNYAIVAAQAGQKVLLIDADLRRPSIHQAFQFPNDVGLTTWLSGKTDNPGSVVRASPVANLDTIVCGPIPKTPAELLVSARLSQLIEWAGGKYDRVIIDCPPVSAVSDPLVVAARCDATLFVTRFNKVRKEHVRRAVLKLKNSGANVIGLCINDLSFDTSEAYYYAYERYGYYSGYHGASAKVASPPSTDGSASVDEAKDEANTRKSPDDKS